MTDAEFQKFSKIDTDAIARIDQSGIAETEHIAKALGQSAIEAKHKQETTQERATQKTAAIDFIARTTANTAKNTATIAEDTTRALHRSRHFWYVVASIVVAIVIAITTCQSQSQTRSQPATPTAPPPQKPKV